MYGKVKNIWDIKSNGGGSSIDTENFASKIKANTFTQKNTFENTGNVINIKTTDTQAFGIAFKNNSDETVGYVGTKVDGSEQKAHFHGYLGLSLETPNKDINFNSGSGAIFSNTSKNWNQHLDNSILRFKDEKWAKISNINYTSVTQPGTSWNRESWNWTLSNLVSNNGINEIMFVISWNDDEICSLSSNILWKSGLSTSKSPIISVEKNDRTYFFKFVLTRDNKLKVETKHDNQGTGATISWVRAWIKRGINLPYKCDTLW